MNFYEIIIPISFNLKKEVIIKPNEVMLDVMGFEIKKIDENNNEINVINNTESNIILEVFKKENELSEEQLKELDSKFLECQNKVDIYKQALDKYKEEGGEKPVAEDMIVDIVENYDCNFKITYKKSI